MTHDTREKSAQAGEPVELYEFVTGVLTRRYTSAQLAVVFNLLTYEALNIERSEFEDTTELPKNDIRLTVPATFAVAELFAVAPPSEVVLLKIYQHHLGETDRVIAWAGRVLNCEWTGTARAELVCENIYTSLRRPGLRRAYQRQCPHELYGPRCRLANTSFMAVMSLTGVNGATLTAPDLLLYATNWFAGGYIEWEPTVGDIVRRAVRSNSADQMIVTHPMPGLTSGNSLRAFFGCDHQVQTCIDKFNNLPNYGGFLYIPQKNPFGQASIY